MVTTEEDIEKSVLRMHQKRRLTNGCTNPPTRFSSWSVFSVTAPPGCLDAADGNDDGTVDISDAITILLYLFTDRGDLPDPFGTCGIDPTADALSCKTYPRCE